MVAATNEAPGQPQSSIGRIFIESAKQDRTEMHEPFAAIGRHDANELVGECAADEHLSTIPAEGSIGTQTNVVTEVRRLRTLETAWIMPRRAIIHRRWGLLPKRLVGPFFVVFDSIEIVGTLLQTQRAAWRDIELERAMKALLPPVLLRFARFDPLHADAQP